MVPIALSRVGTGLRIRINLLVATRFDKPLRLGNAPRQPLFLILRGNFRNADWIYRSKLAGHWPATISIAKYYVAQNGLNLRGYRAFLPFGHITKLATYKALCGAPHNALQTDKQRLGRLVLDFLGEDIMAQVQESPRWMDNVAAHREKLACRVERQTK